MSEGGGFVEVSRDGPVAVLRMAAGENRFRPDTVAALEAALDEVEAGADPIAVVLTGTARFFSNGLDLEWMAGNPDAREQLLPAVHRLLARMLGFPAVTVAAVNGHAYAGGAMLALACDFRVMRADRGYLCLPEVDLGLPFTVGMAELLRAKVPPATATEAVVYGRRYGGADAAAAGLVDEAVAEDEVLPAAVRRAAALAGKHRAALRTIKERHYPVALEALRTDRG